MNIHTVSGKNLSKLGIGSFGIGGRGHRNVELTEVRDDAVYIDAIAYTLTRGLNFTEISAGYAHGQAMKLFKQGLDSSSVKREDVFLTNSLYPVDLADMKTAWDDIEFFYDIFATDYADSTLITASLVAKFGEEIVYKLLHTLLHENRTRFVSISNANISFIREFKREFGEKVFAHEGHLSFEIRALQDSGVFTLCEDLCIANIIWRPLRKGLSAQNDWPLLRELSGRYRKTSNQIILNWMIHLGYHPMVMSTNIGHIDENIEAQNFEMNESDYQRMTDFRPEHYNPPNVDWEKDGNGDAILTLVADFEKHIGVNEWNEA